MKICKICGKNLPLDSFYSYLGGRKPHRSFVTDNNCKKCRNKKTALRNKKNQYYLKNKERIKEWREKTKYNEKMKLRMREVRKLKKEALKNDNT